jgi:trimeric autotransporter adhesin
MAASKCMGRRVRRPFICRTAAAVSLVLLLGSRPVWAGPPDPTASDALANTAGGSNALGRNTTGGGNTAFGFDALYSNTTGDGNTSFGFGALVTNTTGGGNAAFGVEALLSNTVGLYNTASGLNALYSNTTGGVNTASGVNALFSNTTGDNNTASGGNALYSNTTGGDNTVSGFNALYSNTTGGDNTASGSGALYNNTHGVENTASGFLAGLTNIAGNYNTFIGAGADADADYTNGTALGAGALLFASNSVVLGNTSISAIYAHVSTMTAISDRRRKKDIRALDADLGLDFIEMLKPVSYRFNNGDETERYGFIAQDLEQALPASLHDTIERSEPEHGLALIERQNDEDRTYRISYGELFAPIVKSIQQQQQEITELRQQNSELRRSLEDQATAFKAENDTLRHSIAALKEQVTAAR